MRKTCLCAFVAALLLGNGTPPDLPMPNDYGHSIKTRWLNKKVLESRLLDDAESLQTWKLVNTGQAQGELALTRERAVSGASSVRLTSPTTGDKPIPTTRYYGAAAAVRVVNGEDWSSWNRLSFWVYPDLPGFRVISLLVIFHNEGKEAVPDNYGKMGLNYLILQNQQWNHVVWEFANLTRDKVTGIEFSYRLQGNEPGAAAKVSSTSKARPRESQCRSLRGLECRARRNLLQPFGLPGWLAQERDRQRPRCSEFQLINVETGVPALNKAVTPVITQIGRFQVMDFTEVREPGAYIVRAGNRSTRPFRIGTDVWKSSIWKAINFFYVERCGYAIPGVHDACHRDWMLTHGEKKMVVNGGWHDAGDLSQSLPNTAEAAYAMFSLAERLQARGEDPALLARLLEEGQMGPRLAPQNYLPRRLPPRLLHHGPLDQWHSRRRGRHGVAGGQQSRLQHRRRGHRGPCRTCTSKERSRTRGVQPEAGEGRLGFRHRRNGGPPARTRHRNGRSCRARGAGALAGHRRPQIRRQGARVRRHHHQLAAARVPPRAHLPPGRVLLYRARQSPHSALLAPSHEDAPVVAFSAYVRVVSQSRRLDEVVFGRHPVLGILPESHGAIHPALRHAGQLGIP